MNSDLKNRLLIGGAAILMPHLLMTPFWYLRTSISSDWLALCQMFYSAFIGPFIIGLFSISEMVRLKDNLLIIVGYGIALTGLGLFWGYTNWGFSTGCLLSPDSASILIVVFEGKAASIIIGLLLLIGIIAVKTQQKPNKVFPQTRN